MSSKLYAELLPARAAAAMHCCAANLAAAKEVIPIQIQSAIAIAMLCIAFATLVVKIIEVSRK